jgi:RNA polymerase sigma-70 factor, ECF subfamily
MSDEPPESETFNNDDLVVRAKTDRAAFSLLYERYYPRVARYCLRRVFDRAAAEDVLSNVFLDVASHLSKFSGRTDTDFCRWLFRIATNEVNAHLRQTRRRQKLWQTAASSGRWDHKAKPCSSPAENDTLDWPAVYQALMELDERERTIVTLRFFGDCSHEEIAAIVDATPGAVRTALSRTLARLRNKFNPAVPTDPEFELPPLG